ncbi:MAG TPA: tRNA isopentenyl-2-thiomethyl-A-37 hydroxylase MiaE [Kofleriaceae bacterium]|nr:tRNA isopentenyl-2-thiomethyl-A-37 hydroxylase MiaE [Kofleriaceae bacterium]
MAAPPANETDSGQIDVPGLPLTATHPRWIEVALGDLDAVLCDHLHCERKAAQSALSMVRAYPDRADLVAAVARLAHEETSHVVQVSQLLARRGVDPRFDLGDDYVRALRAGVRRQDPGRLIDHLIVFALIEARSAERLALLGEAIPEPETAALYRALATAELRHRDTFVRLALDAGPRAEVIERLRELAGREADIVAALPIRPRIH